MRFPIIFLLLSLSASSSATIYWMNTFHLLNTVEAQTKLVMFAHENKDPTLLYKLVEFDGTIDRYLASLHHRKMKVQVQEAYEGTEESITGIVLVTKGGQTYSAKLQLVPCSKSPTGYKIHKAMVCKSEGCRDD